MAHDCRPNHTLLITLLPHLSPLPLQVQVAIQQLLEAEDIRHEVAYYISLDYNVHDKRKKISTRCGHVVCFSLSKGVIRRSSLGVAMARIGQQSQKVQLISVEPVPTILMPFLSLYSYATLSFKES